ncbi:iron-sulfur cluster repair di-iron protein [Niallia endozanthoxylica]|uniref:Iron-sulfur cluster repair di-iron protein n=1 Tax=Niallia endozanthoxylica TaxID=2036016 RepID=A0A5J5HX29_9BACI|nr:iron-sulfur cluster repair di-iron protein [Niallia endozanthoxylica]KAA9027532.1 iron-sulfur cluster repair di-iron protein [Niallia endozanthoxylica]
MTTIPFSNTSLVRDIVNEVPKTSDVFKKYRIDFCCGGNTPISTAAAELNVNLDELMEELANVYAKSDQSDNMEVWTNSSSEEIIQHIIDYYHNPLREELAALSPYVTKVAKVHGDSHPELLKVYELFYELKKELIEHTLEEEATSFPLLLSLEKNEVENREEAIEVIRKLESEHDHAGNLLREIREVTNDFTLPLDACGTYRLVYNRLEMLESHTFMHVHLENNILFPRYI